MESGPVEYMIVSFPGNRFRGEIAPALQELLSKAPVWPALMDVLAHEHDVRAAVGEPGARDIPEIGVCARRLTKFWFDGEFRHNDKAVPCRKGGACRDHGGAACGSRLHREY